MGAPDDAMEGLQAPFVATHGTLEPFEVPRVVYGTYKRKKDAVIEPLRLALTAGFTAVDTAFVYNNEAAVGKVLADRPDVMVATKLWRSHYSHEAADVAARLEAHEQELGRRVDLWLLHWPGPGRHPKTGAPKPADWSPAMRESTWQHMCRLLEAGRVGSVGVSNFSVAQLTGLHRCSGRWPAVNQIECHPLCRRSALLSFCAAHGVLVLVYGLLGARSPLLLSHPDLLFLSASLSRSPARILLDWAAAHRLVPVVSSAQPQHLAELMAPPQPLPPDAMALLDSMEERHGTHVLGWTNADSDLDAVDVPNPAVGDKWTN